MKNKLKKMNFNYLYLIYMASLFLDISNIHLLVFPRLGSLYIFGIVDAIVAMFILGKASINYNLPKLNQTYYFSIFTVD